MKKNTQTHTHTRWLISDMWIKNRRRRRKKKPLKEYSDLNLEIDDKLKSIKPTKCPDLPPELPQCSWAVTLALWHANGQIHTNPPAFPHLECWDVKLRSDYDLMPYDSCNFHTPVETVPYDWSFCHPGQTHSHWVLSNNLSAAGTF